jgi:hypothetical protein
MQTNDPFRPSGVSEKPSEAAGGSVRNRLSRRLWNLKAQQDRGEDVEDALNEALTARDDFRRNEMRNG